MHNLPNLSSPNQRLRAIALFKISLLAVIGLKIAISIQPPNGSWLPEYDNLDGTPPLVMQGGDPYIRALMRTITASEANVAQPYHVLYGGQYVEDLSRHPEQCVTITTGANQGNCTTAAGRYQFINTTWDEQAKRYHPKPGVLFWRTYSFEPRYQDAVVHAWLSDRQAWGVDLGQLLRQGEIDEVLRRLSPTWTSLGYGIETNSMSRRLPQVYQTMLQEELG